MLCAVIQPEYAANVRLKRKLEAIHAVLNHKGLPLLQMKHPWEISALKEKPSIAFVLGASEGWSKQTVESLCAEGIHPIVVGFQLDDTFEHSYVTYDYLSSFYTMTKYLAENSGPRIALLGMNPDSAPDKRKAYGFFQGMKELGYPVGEGEVYYNYGDSDVCVRHFLNSGQDFDSVLCTNDLIAVLLLSKRKMSESYLVAGFGDMLLGKFTMPPLITGTIDDREMGKCAADIACYILDNPKVAGIGITVGSKLRGKHLEKQEPPFTDGAEQPVTIDFFGCETISELDRLEALLSSMDREDYVILHGITQKKTYEEIAEQIFLSTNAVKYRIKKMLGRMQVDSKEKLLSYIKKYQIKL